MDTLDKKLEEWLNTVSDYSFINEDKENYIKWKKDQESSGLKIVYLCSVDT